MERAVDGEAVVVGGSDVEELEDDEEDLEVVVEAVVEALAVPVVPAAVPDGLTLAMAM